MVTMQDVARRAGVSAATVSFALNNTRPVAPATRQRIEAAMAELGFRRNALARGLASRRSRILALALPAGRSGLNSTVMEFVAGVTESARSHGYHLVLWPLGHDQADELSNLCRQGLSDGVILMDVHLQDRRVDAVLAERVPAMLIGRTADLSIPHVDVDFEATARDAVRYLANLGHARLGFINHSQRAFEAGYGPAVRVVDGLVRAAAEAGVTCEQRFADESAESGRVTVHHLLDEHPEITGIIVMNDDASFGVLQAARERDLRVPDDLSILSIVSSPGSSEQTFPALTTFHAPGLELGRLSATALIGLLEHPNDPTPRSALLPCTLAEGHSTAPAPDRP